MRTRVAGLLVVLTLVVLLVPSPTVAQSSNAPRTPWGDPDLQGIWSYASLTPLQRPADLSNREFFTPEEAASRNAATSVDRPPQPGSVGNYNALWFDRGTIDPSLRTSLIIDPPDGRLPLTQETQARIASEREYRDSHPADSWLDRSPWDRCITYHGVPPVSTGYNNTYHIVQSPEYVAILVENIHDVRIIPLDGQPQLDSSIRQWNGDSRGHWEGDTLVVKTTNYSAQTRLRFPSSPETTAVERFTRINADLIDYQFTVEDPSVYTSAWTAVRPMPRIPDYRIYEYSCHEGNYAMSNILSGERQREKATARD